MRFLALLQLKHLENMTKVQERTISDLEDENVQLAKEHEERQLLWEQREVELERTIDKLEKQQEQLADAAAKFEEATGSIPDPDLPVANQLEMAITNIKEHIRIIVGTREESRALKKVTILKKRNRKPENKGLWTGECAKLWKALSRSAEYGVFFLLLLDMYILLVYKAVYCMSICILSSYVKLKNNNASSQKYEELDQAFKQSEERLTQKDKVV